jgi:hypothetical protein
VLSNVAVVRVAKKSGKCDSLPKTLVARRIEHGTLRFLIWWGVGICSSGGSFSSAQPAREVPGCQGRKVPMITRKRN